MRIDECYGESQMSEKDWGRVRQDASQLEEDFQALASEEALEETTQGKGALDHPSYADLEKKLTLAEQTAHENWEKSVRALAELDNVRRRAERDVSNAHRYGLEKFVIALLPVVDSLEQAIALVDQETHGSMGEGLHLTLKLFTDVLEKFEVQQLDPINMAFDPQQHEAMSLQAAEGVAANTVLMVLQKGYVLHQRVIRPARVIVSK